MTAKILPFPERLTRGFDVAFWDGVSKGTAHTIERARRLGKPVEIRTP